jgi:ribonuclease PH
VALHLAFAKLVKDGAIAKIPLIGQVAAVSCGLCDGVAVLDLDYPEDSTAQADANFVLTDAGAIVEVQGTAEKDPFSEAQFTAMLGLAKLGIKELNVLQRQAVGL